MTGTIILKRDPVTVGAVLTALLALLGVSFEWPAAVTVAAIGVVTAGVAVVQALNTFGTDKFTAIGLNVVGAAIGLVVSLNIEVSDEMQTAIMAVAVTVFGLFARNGVTNRYGPTGQLKLAPVGVAGNEVPMHQPPATPRP